MSDINKGRNYGWLTLIIVIFLALIVLFFYLDRQDYLSHIIRTWGLAGIMLAILLMTALSMTPIPSEGLLILLFKIFGIYEGLFYAWLGSILSSLVIYYLARYYGHSLFKRMISSNSMEQVDRWVQKKGTAGLFIARLLPVPAFAINYIAGIMPSIKLWPYMWTAALSIIPYYIGTALVYVGVYDATWIWLAAGGAAIILIWGISYYLTKKSR
jgi:uncharacterized membrane protein YdjX (TVP38/TMEM64 family)